MPYSSVAEAEARIQELESENRNLTRESINHKKGYQSQASFLSEKGFDPKGDLEEQWNNLVGKSSSELEKLRSEQSKFSKIIERMENENKQLAEEKNNSTINTELLKLIGTDVIDAQDLIDLWITKKSVKLSGNKVVFVEGDSETPISTAIDNWKKSHPSRIAMRQNSGGGSNGHTDREEKKSEKLTEEKFNKMNLKAQQDFYANGGKVVRNARDEEDYNGGQK
jgi:hypothetical protein